MSANPSRAIIFEPVNLLSLLRSILVAASVTLVTVAAAPGVCAQQDASEQAIAIFGHGQDLHEKGDLAGAVAQYEKALKLLPEFPEAEYQRAAAEISLGNLDEAEASLRRATTLRPDWSLAWAALGDVLVKKVSGSGSVMQEAEAALRRAIELDGANAPAYSALVDLQLRGTSKPAELKATLDNIRPLTDGKSQPPASLWTARAALELALGDTKGAKASASRSMEIDPRNIAVLFLSADIALKSDDLERAKQLASDLTSRRADSSKLLMLNARIAVAEGRYPEAGALLDKLPDATPGVAELKKAIDAATTTDVAGLEKQLAQDPKNLLLLDRLCSGYRREDPTKALEYCRRASELDPTNIKHAVGYAAALVQAKQFVSAGVILGKLVTMDPENRTIHANLATVLFELKRYPEAIKQFEWLSSSDPKAAAPYFFLGIAYDLTEDYVDSLAAYEQYMKLADPVANKLEIDKVTYRLPAVRQLVKEGKGKKR